MTTTTEGRAKTAKKAQVDTTKESHNYVTKKFKKKIHRNDEPVLSTESRRSALKGADHAVPADGKPARAKIVGEKAKTAQRQALRSRIVGHADVNPANLKAHAMNFRKHGAAQVSALSGSMNDLGWIKSVMVSKRTGTIIDGHARVEEALRRKLPTIPVEYVDLSPDEERKALALIDPITEMATRDDGMFQKLLDSLSTEDAKLTETLEKFKPLKEAAEQIISTATTTDIMTYDPNVFFPSSNKWGIPDLDPKMLYDGDVPLTTYPAEDLQGAPQLYIYGANGFDERVAKRVICFYTEDWRFERIWSESVESLKTIVPLKPAGFISPDFSLWADDPLVVQMWNIYRARWISRYWQAAGLKLIPSLATSTNKACYEFAYEGFPKKPSLMAMQLRAGGYKDKVQVNSVMTEVAQLIEQVAPQRLMLYGVKSRAKIESSLPGGTKYFWCDDFTSASFGKYHAKKAKEKQDKLHEELGKKAKK